MDKDIMMRRSEILQDISKASLEDISQILEHYKSTQTLDGSGVNLQPITIDGVTYHSKYKPQEAAALNARYKELTGQDHPVFMEEQAKVLDLMLDNKDKLLQDGYMPMQIDTLEQLRANLTQETPVLASINPSHPFLRRSDVMLNLSQASLEDVSQILEHYKSSQVLDCGRVNMQPVLVNGVTHHSKYNPQEAASLNARYKELTGQDHPVFMEEQAKVLDLMLDNKEKILEDGYMPMQIDTLEQLRANLMQETPAIEVVSGRENHILSRTTDILMKPQDASLEDISQLLNYYNGKPVVMDGISYHPFNDPMSASKLNARYRELTGQDHPTFVEQAPKVIDGLMADKDMLVQAGAYDESYFSSLEQMRNEISGKKDITPSAMNIENATKQDLVQMREQLQQMKDTPQVQDSYQAYREQISQAYLEEKDSNTFLHSQFSVRDGEKPQCDHTLERINDEGRTVLQQRTFDYNDEFKQNMLEPAITDYAQCSPVMSSDIKPHQTDAGTNPQMADYRAVSENNNVLSVNNVQPEYANAISSAVQQIEPVAYQQQMNQQMAMQQQMGGPTLTLTMGGGGMSGFVNALVLALIVGFIVGLGIILGIHFIG